MRLEARNIHTTSGLEAGPGPRGLPLEHQSWKSLTTGHEERHFQKVSETEKPKVELGQRVT